MAISELINEISNHRGWRCYHPFESTVSVVQRPHDFFLCLSNLITTQSEKAEM